MRVPPRVVGISTSFESWKNHDYGVTALIFLSSTLVKEKNIYQKSLSAVNGHRSVCLHLC